MAIDWKREKRIAYARAERNLKIASIQYDDDPFLGEYTDLLLERINDGHYDEDGLQRIVIACIEYLSEADIYDMMSRKNMVFVGSLDDLLKENSPDDQRILLLSHNNGKSKE